MLPLSPSDAAKLQAHADFSTSPQARPGRGDLLSAEYLYAMHTALQANEDRNKALNFFILITSITVAALSQFKGTNAPSVAYIGLLGGLGLIGWCHFFNIIRLRQAFHESVRCMNRLKEYWLENYPDDVKFRNAFLWKTTSIPAPDRAWTISFFAALTITLISAASLGGAVAVAISDVLTPLATPGTPPLSPNAQFVVGLAATVALALAQIAVYFVMLRDRRTD